MALRGSKVRHRSRLCSPLGCSFLMIAIFISVVYFGISGQDQDSECKLYSYRLVRDYPHDAEAFTQGLFYHGNDTLYESTGLYGLSTVRSVHLQTGKTKKVRKLKKTDFGEGLTQWDDKLLQVTWKTRKVYVYDRENLKPLSQLKHPMEDGWGLTNDDKHIIGSDGSATIYFMDPENFAEVRRVVVTDNGHPVRYLNELEYVKGEIWANVWQTECIARISPRDGRVVGWILLQGLRSTLIAAGYKHLDVLNGIAWDSERDRLFVTGKVWPKLYEIALEPMTETIDHDSIRVMCIV